MEEDNPTSSSAAAESYIGSVISLTSKSEIRYEGILVSIDTQESKIALQNVRTYGSEGRRKDGPQIPPSDKEYEYILFRGNDIKDLQVKSSPPIHTKPQIHHEAAITQSHNTYASGPHTSSASVGFGNITSLGSNTAHLDVVKQPMSDKVSLYQTGAYPGSWAASSALPNNETAAVPMYSQGYFSASSGQAFPEQQPVYFHPQSTLHNLSQYSDGHAPTRKTNLVENGGPLPQQQPVYFHPQSTLHNLSQYSDGHAPTRKTNLAENSGPLAFPSQFKVSNPAYLSSLLSSSSSFLPGSSSSLPSNVLGMPSLDSSNQELDTMGLISHEARPSPTSVYPVSSFPYTSSSIPVSASGHLVAYPPLLTPDHLANSLSVDTSTLYNFYPEPKDMDHLLPPLTDPMACGMSQAPLMSLPAASQQGQVGATSRFSEEFDFTAMYEKFNKDEVWGTLGKERRGTTTGGAENYSNHYYNVEVKDDYYSQDVHNPGSRPVVYNKDDFFDTLSCTSLNRGAWSGRSRFSERMRQDTETFGEFQRRPNLGRGSGAPPHYGNYYYNRGGSYNRGRGYGYHGGNGHDVYRPF